jgi:hypothetical protein
VAFGARGETPSKSSEFNSQVQPEIRTKFLTSPGVCRQYQQEFERIKMKSPYPIFCALLVMSSLVFADGINFKGDRVDGEITTVITLTEEQKTFLDAKPKKKDKSVVRSISLDSEQKKLLEKEAGFAPEKMDVWPLKSAKETCTCELINIGVRFEPDKLEIPHFLLGKDFNDRLKSKEDREKEKANSEQKNSPDK